MHSNSSNPESNKDGWVVMTELTVGGCAAPSDDDKTASSPGSSLGPQTPPTGATTTHLFGANKPGLGIDLCPGHYTHSPSTYSTKYNSPAQCVPRALASSDLTASNYQQLSHHDFQPRPGSNTTAWLPACNGCIQRPCQEGLGDPTDFRTNEQEREKSQFKPLVTKLKPKKAKNQENQENKYKNQKTNDQQNNFKAPKTSKLEHRQNQTEKDDESISDFDLNT